MRAVTRSPTATPRSSFLVPLTPRPFTGGWAASFSAVAVMATARHGEELVRLSGRFSYKGRDGATYTARVTLSGDLAREDLPAWQQQFDRKAGALLVTYNQLFEDLKT